jgi:hypothetical protein
VAVSPAVEMLVDRARRRWPAFAVEAGNAAWVAELVRRLDGVPLAIELVADKLSTLPVQEILPQLDNGSLRWQARDLPARHQSLGEAVGWSWHALPEPLRRPAARRSPHPGQSGDDAAPRSSTGAGSTSRVRTKSAGEGGVELTGSLRVLGSGGEQAVPNYLLAFALGKLLFDAAGVRRRVGAQPHRRRLSAKSARHRMTMRCRVAPLVRPKKYGTPYTFCAARNRTREEGIDGLRRL